jgi:alkylation response protein AidB-like acyl-CoA dehydrogenase
LHYSVRSTAWRPQRRAGQSIGKFQALQHRIADMAIAVEQSRLMAVLAAARIDVADRAERRRAISAAKPWWADAVGWWRSKRCNCTAAWA